MRDQQETGMRGGREMRVFVSLLPQYEATVGWLGPEIITFSRWSLYMTLSSWVLLTVPSLGLLSLPWDYSSLLLL